MVIRELVRECIAELRNSNIENPVFDANLTVRTVLGLEPIDMVLERDKEVSESDESRIRRFCARRCKNEPLQYILGVQEFMGLEFFVDRNVLVPRADTEALVEAVLTDKRGMNVLDICTGSGCIALSIAHFNKNAFVTGLDISENALAVAKKNAEKLKLSNRVKFEKCDITKEFPRGCFDVIVSNPPYIETGEIEKLQKEVKLYEPHIALDGGADGLVFYRRISEIAPAMLQEHGRLYFEVGYNQAEAVEDIMLKSGLKNVIRIKDLCGVDRVLCGERQNNGG